MNAQAIHTSVITVKYADPPKDGKKQATVRSDAGEVFGVWPKDLGLFQRGRRYRVEYTERRYQGRDYRTVVKVEPEEAPARTTRQEASPATSAPSGEAEFVSRCLAASIMSGTMGRSKEELIERARLLRSVWRDVFGA